MMLWMNTAHAQRGNRGQKGTPEERAEKTTQRLASKLGLDETQKTQVKASALKFETARKTARSNRDRSAVKTARQTFQDEMKGILTTEQYAKFEKMQKRRKGRKGSRG
ncbi:MAG TPA: multiple ligand-binding protein 1 [Microscillaceae bacterium]|nr:multiple ligand-binding protein 1 [Microscillaceae bacterium]